MGTKLQIILFVVVILFAIGIQFTDNVKTKTWGGSSTIELAEGERLVNATWKDANLWILTKTNPTVEPGTYKFQESSTLGVFEGTITIIEK